MNGNIFDGKKAQQVASLLNDIRAESNREIGELKAKEFNSIVAGGAIKVHMNGDYVVTQIDLDPDYIATHMLDQVSKLLASAFNNCRFNIEREMDEITDRYSRKTQEALMSELNKSSDSSDGDPEDGEGLSD